MLDAECVAIGMKMDPQLKVGELAKLAGVSVRTLHHYQEIGLLLPSGRSASDYRLYGSQEVVRLQQITSLREVGMPLAAIREFLDGESDSPWTCLRMHILALDQKIARQTELRDRLNLLLDDVERQGSVDQDRILSTLRAINEMAKHFSSVQIEQLQRRSKAVGADRIAEVQREWTRILETFQNLAANDAPPTSPEAIAAAKEAMSLISEFSGGDAAIEEGLAAKYRDEGVEQIFARYGVPYDAAGWTLMQQAMDAARK